MSKKLKAVICAALAFYGATMFCMGANYSGEVGEPVTLIMALSGAVFSVLSRIIYNRERKAAVRQ